MDVRGMDRGAAKQTLRAAISELAASRRQFLWVGGISIVGMSALGPGLTSKVVTPLIWPQWPSLKDVAPYPTDESLESHGISSLRGPRRPSEADETFLAPRKTLGFN